MNANMARLLVAGVLVYLAMQGAGIVSGSLAGPYTGRLVEVHSAASTMASADRRALAESLEAAGEMLASDRLGLVSTTEELQRYVKAVTEFDYLGVGKPSAKYPAVAKAVQAALETAIGSEVAPVTAQKRAEVSAVLVEAGKAVR